MIVHVSLRYLQGRVLVLEDPHRIPLLHPKTADVLDYSPLVSPVTSKPATDGHFKTGHSERVM